MTAVISMRKYVQAIGRILAFVQSEAFLVVTCQGAIARLECLEERWNQCKGAYDEIVKGGTMNLDIGVCDEEMERAEDFYFEARAALREKLEELRPIVQEPSVPANVQVELQYSQRQMDLQNNWGEFDGTLTKWKGFHDRFKAAVHNNEQVTPAIKFSYLQQSLVGKAARTFGEWQLTDENYQEAWERMKQLYDKKYHTCREYLRLFYRLPFLERATSEALQHMSNVTHETLRQLRAQGLPVAHWDMVVVHSLHERLDEETGKAWELQRQSETPTATDILTFLGKQAAASSHKQEGRREHKAASAVGDQQQERKRGARRDAAIRQTVPARPLPCRICQGDHGLFECQKFLSLSMRSRKAYVERNNLCPNCLKQGHTPRDCYSGPCVRFPGRMMHNSVLCPTRDDNKHLLQVRKRAGDERASKIKTPKRKCVCTTNEAPANRARNC